MNRLLVFGLGYTGAAIADAAREAGFDLHMPKPLDIDRFVSLLRGLAARQPAVAANEGALRSAAP